jgi:hypothetical protein
MLAHGLVMHAKRAMSCGNQPRAFEIKAAATNDQITPSAQKGQQKTPGHFFLDP